MERVPRFQVAGGVILCNSCGSYNSSDKILSYSSCPTMIGDVKNLPQPKELISCHSMWTQHSLAPEFEKIHLKFLNRWEQYQGNRPEILYHYTSHFGLESIVQSGKVWFSDIAFLNDASEMQLAIDLISEYTGDIDSDISELGRELIRRSSVNYTPDSPANGFFVACFCADGDLLSQWRAYGGGGGGYALGFNSREMANAGNIRVRKIVYDPELQKSFVQEIVNDTLCLLDRVAGGRSIKDLDRDEHTLPTFCAFLATHLTELLCSFKHCSFREEGEWRLIYDFQRDQDINELKFRLGNGFPVPYLEMPLSLQKEKMPNSPLVQIIHGPTLHPKLTQKSLALMLQRDGMEHVEVTGSESPLRA
eukprot:TRINITY_DN310_c0_g1_i3.p1 TRINITY_DN310_c0_g1~~TRINITY_DN310_c0_g1_i3.p1  ORF type:complete len:363 (-),score=-2.43 TRINITY_DN310_c0_g1_i3:1353-2441(-)